MPKPRREAGSDAPPPASAGYYTWTTTEIDVRGHRLAVSSKPGVLAGGGVDPAALLLAGTIEATPAESILDLNCGAGLVGVVAARLAPSARIVMAAATLVDVEAARRTLAAAGVTPAEVHLSSGTSHLSLAAPVDLAVIRVPKGKLPTLQLIWDAFSSLKPGGRCYLAGANDEGIQSALRHAGDLFGSVATVTYRQGHRVGLAVKSAEPPTLPAAFRTELLDHATFHQFAVDLRGDRYQVYSRPGVFSWERLDEGTRALIEAMEIRAGETVLDLGCGYGIAGIVAAKLSGVGAVTLVDVALEAVESARRTVTANGLTNCQVLPSDCAAAVRHLRFDVVVANPPFHVGKGATYDTAQQFIRDAAALLRPGGRLYLVANRFIPYERTMARFFDDATVVFASGRYKVLGARQPGRPPRPQRGLAPRR